MTNEPLREAVKAALAEWDILPRERKYTLEDVTDWMQRFMAPAMEKLREAIATKPTRYNWPEILEAYPWARWAATDEDGLVTVFSDKPVKAKYSWIWVSFTNWDTVNSLTERLCPDWRDSLEPCPPELLPKG